MRKFYPHHMTLEHFGGILKRADHFSLSNPNSAWSCFFPGCDSKCFTDCDLNWKDANFSEINLLLQKLELGLWKVFWPESPCGSSSRHLASVRP